MAAAARRVRGESPLTEEQLLVRFTDFAFRVIRNPSFGELSPGVRVYYLLNPMHPGPSDVLRWGSDYRGGCGSHTRVVVSMLQASGVQSRPLFLLDGSGTARHTVVQARVDGRWVVADSYYGIIYRRRDGQLATAPEIAADPAWYREQTQKARNYPASYDYGRVSIMNWQKVPVLLPALRALSIAAFGAEPVDDFARPSIWMWPRAMMSLGSLAAALLLAIIAGWRGRRRQRSGAEAPERARRAVAAG